jgi:hypothetical protein
MYWTNALLPTSPAETHLDLSSLEEFMFCESMKENLFMKKPEAETEAESEPEAETEAESEPEPELEIAPQVDTEDDEVDEIIASLTNELRIEPDTHGSDSDDDTPRAALQQPETKTIHQLPSVKPCQDPLFWSIYRAIHGPSEYARVAKNGNVEMDEKRKTMEAFHRIGSKVASQQMNLKFTKAGSVRMSDELLTKPKTPITCIPMYCLYYECSIYIVNSQRKTILSFVNDSASQRILLYTNPDTKNPMYYIDTEEQLHTLEYLCMHYVCLESAEKPFKAASHYKMTDLELMASMVGMEILPKTKKNELYEKLVVHCM